MISRSMEQSFFMEGTLRICSSLDIEKALGGCFEFIRQYIPVEEIYLHFYHRDTASTHSFAMADKDGGRPVDITIKWPKHLANWVERDDFPREVIVNKADEHPFFKYALKIMKREKISILLVTLTVDKNWVGAVTLWATDWERFAQKHLDLFLLLKKPFAIAMSNYRQLKELAKLRDNLADDKNYLQQQLQMTTGTEVIGAEFGLKNVMEMVRQVSFLDSPVLLRGETGTGKEVIANAIYNLSSRRRGPFIKVNCGAIPKSLMGSELFGHEKGAFTGAIRSNRGRFERADGGTLFLDEIGELPLDAQVHLLRVLQDKTIERVGGNKTIEVNVRIIAATHRNLEKMIHEKRFREDLFFRLHVFPIIIPPLRQRKMDIPELLKYFLTKKKRELGFANVPELDQGILDYLTQYDWPGNVRELENMVERALILNPNGPIIFEKPTTRLEYDDPNSAQKNEPGPLLLNQVITMHIHSILNMTGGKVNGKNGAAQLMGVNPSTLRNKMRKMKIPFGRNETDATKRRPNHK